MADEITVTCPRCGEDADAQAFPHHSGGGALDFHCRHCNGMGWLIMTPAEVAGLQALGIDIEIPDPPITDAEANAVGPLLDNTDAAWFDFWTAELHQR